MGYYSKLSGSLSFHPFLTEGEVEQVRLALTRSSLEYQDAQANQYFLEMDGNGDPCKCYQIEKELAAIAAVIPEVGISGYIVRVGEDNGDVERYYFHEGKVVSEQAVMTWPDGEKVVL